SSPGGSDLRRGESPAPPQRRPPPAAESLPYPPRRLSESPPHRQNDRSSSPCFLSFLMSQHLPVAPQKCLGALVGGGEHLRRSSLLHDDPVRHKDHPVGDIPGEGHLVGDDHHG